MAFIDIIRLLKLELCLDGKKRIAAIEKISDQVVLARIVKNDKAYEVELRRAAIRKVTDQPLLVNIAINDKDSDIREAAVKKLTDQDALAEIAKNSESWHVREAAYEKTGDELSGSTKLHIACSHGDVEEVKKLLAQGAEMNIANKWGATPLDLTYSNGAGSNQLQIFAEIARLLRAKGGITKTWKGGTF